MFDFFQNNKIKRFLSCLGVSVLLSSIFLYGGLIPEATLTTEAASVIPINTAADLQKIGNDSAFPLDGDYVLTDDIDLSGINFTPIGGIMGNRGSISGGNVFSGTFDGQGYLISNMTIQSSQTITSGTAQFGLFANIASDDPNDYAEVKNIVFAEVLIDADVIGGFTSAGVLSGDFGGYAKADNIAVLGGELLIAASNRSDVVGAGGIIGEIRTDSPIGNTNITLSNLYNAAAIHVGSSTNINYAGGIIGRVAYSNCQSITSCVNVGLTYFKGDLGAAISNFGNNATSDTLSNSYFLFDTGRPSASGTTELPAEAMKTATLLDGLDASKWYASEEMFPLPIICQNPAAAGYLSLAMVAPTFANNEDASTVSSNFTLPLNVSGIPITWTSSDPSVITINGDMATVTGVLSDTKLTLTANTPEGLTKKFNITVVSNIKATFEQNYASPGSPLKVVIRNAPADMALTYSWKVGGTAVNNFTDTYTPTLSDLEKFISVSVTSTNYPANWDVDMYCSEMPVIYIDTVDGKPITDLHNYKNANFKIQGNAEFSDPTTYYDGLTEVRGRGNSTWSYSHSNGLKKPYKIKLDKKANVLGMGSNKHWALLANLIDHTNMRNQLMYEFSNDIGMEYYMESTSVVLIVNGTYDGLYQLAEHKRIAETRVDIFEWEGLAEDIASAIASREGLNSVLPQFEDAMKEDLSWHTTGHVTFLGNTYKVSDYYTKPIPEFTGGFLMDMDFRLNDSKYISKFWTTHRQPLFFDTPEFAKSSPTMMNYTQNYIQSFEDALHSDDFYANYNGESVHYSELFDLPSLLRNWMVVEYSMNWDGMKNSTLMYKDLEGKMKMGPAWDFDWCWGNMNMYSIAAVWKIDNWHTTEQSFMEQRPQQEEQWNRYLIKDPYFAVLAYELWQDIRPTYIQDMIKSGGKIDQLQAKLKTASEANDARWSYSYNRYNGTGIANGVPVRKNSSELYADAMTTMKYFINERVKWFDTKFTSPDDLLTSWGRYVGSNQISVSKIDTTSQTNATEFTVNVASQIQSTVPKIGFYVNGIKAGIANVSGGIAKLTVPDTALRSEDGVENVIQIRALNASDNFVKSGSNVITNYKRFTKEVAAELTGTAAIQGRAIVGNDLQATLTGSNATGDLSYQWFADDVAVINATEQSYTLTSSDIGKQFSVTIASNIESGSLQSSKTNPVIDVTTDHALIYQIYGGGGKSDTPLSHNFIELYNPTGEAIDLTGYKIGYMSRRGGTGNHLGNTDGVMIEKELTGAIPAYTSYLIRCAPEVPAAKVFNIDTFDLDWSERFIDNNQYQVILYKSDAVIDAVSVGEASVEGTPLTGISKQRSIRRVDGADTNDNASDFAMVAYNTLAANDDVAGYEAVRPRDVADGPWGAPEEPPVVTPTPTQPPKQILPTSIRLNNSAISLKRGTSTTLSTTILPANATSKSIQWSTSDAKVAVVTKEVGAGGKETGRAKVTAKGKGTAKITAKTANGRTAVCTITVGEVKLNVKSAKMQVKQKTKVFVVKSSYPKNDKIVKWTSSKPSVAIVNKKGQVTAKKTGTTILTVTMKSNATATIKLKVQKAKVKTKKLKVPKSISLKKGKKHTLKLTRTPVTANDKLTFTSSAPNVATVTKKGVVKGISKGTSRITIKAASGKKTSVKIQVK